VVDFWSEAKDKADGTARHGTVKCVSVGEPKVVSRGHASIVTKNEWMTPDGVKILDEERTLHFQDLKVGRLFTFESRFTASVCPISFGDTKEGSFGVRVNDELMPKLKDGATVTSSDGTVLRAPTKDDMSVWGKPANWIDYSGRVGGKSVGVTLFEDPANAARGGWHARAYGLLAVNPFGRDHSGFPSQKGKTDLFKIAKGGELVVRYGVYAHIGDVQSGKVAEAFETFKKGK
jgi:hypothetical protein